MQSKKQTTKDQHIVPKFYLKLFADKEGKLEVLDIKNARFDKRRHCSGLAYKPFFYAKRTGEFDDISQEFESGFNKIEDEIAKEIPLIIERILGLKPIGHKDRSALSLFLSMLWLRTETMRASIQRMSEQMKKDIKEIVLPREEKVVAPIQNKNNSIDSNTEHLTFLANGLEKFAKMFFVKKWKIYIAKGERKFITSDTPVAEWFPPRTIFWGPSFLCRKHYFPLTPEILIELTCPKGNRKIKRETLFAEDDDKVMVLNMLILGHCFNFGYSNDRQVLEDLLVEKNKFTKWTRMYFEKFPRE